MLELKWILYLTFVWSICFGLSSVIADLDKTCTLDHRIRSNQGICGEKLSEILHFLCGVKGYNKRSIPDDEMALRALEDRTEQHEEDESQDIFKDNSIFISKDKALSFLRKDVKRSARHHGNGDGYRGIVCECCHHRCSIRELTQYCADPSSSLAARFTSSMGKRSVSRTNDASKPDSRAYDSTKTSGSFTKALLDLNRHWHDNERPINDEEFTGERNAHSKTVLDEVDLPNSKSEETLLEQLAKSIFTNP